MDNKQEVVPVVNANGDVLGSITRGEAHDGRKILHPVVHLHLFNSKGELYLQRRPEWKDIQPGKWDTDCGGHVDYGETPDEALRRAVSEELGVDSDKYTPKRLGMYVFESLTERELVYVNSAVYDGEVKPSDSELNGGRFWSREEILSSIGKGILTPNFESEYQKFFGEPNIDK